MTHAGSATDRSATVSGITLKSVAASLFAIILAAVITQYATLILATDQQFGMLGLPVAALAAIGCVLLVSAIVRVYAKAQLFTRQEMLVIFYAALIAAPLASGALWRPLLPLLASAPRTGDFRILDSIHPALWPHGENIATGALGQDSPYLLNKGLVRWSDSPGPEPTALLENKSDEKALLEFEFPIAGPSERRLRRATPYVFAIEARIDELGANSSLLGRLFYDDSQTFAEELFITQEKSEPNYLRPDAFAGIGKYNVSIPPNVRTKVRLEISLQGIGRAHIRDLQIYSIEALETAYTGRRMVSAESSARLSPDERSGLIVKPASWLSKEGLLYIVGGYIPLREWGKPLLIWGGYVFLLFTAVYVLLIIMRRQWFDRERYFMPLGRVASWVLGFEPDTAKPVKPSMWANKTFIGAFSVSLAWALLVGFSIYNPAVPELRIAIALKPYFNSPLFGDMWTGVTFFVTFLILGLALFMEINVLVSIVIGYFLFRSNFWFGETYGLSTDPAFPYLGHQMVGAYLGYAGLILLLSRKYLLSNFKLAFRQNREPHDECLSPRAALIVLALCLSGFYLWSRYLNFPFLGVVIGVIVLSLTAFAMAKFRSEIGLPISILLHRYCIQAILLFNALPLFGGESLLFFIFLTIVVGQNYLLVTPGVQLEFTELGMRYGIKRREIFATGLLAVTAGLAIGAWATLTTVYGRGIDNLPATWEMSAIWQRDLSTFLQAVNTASQSAEIDQFFWTTGHTAISYGAGGAILTGILRNLWAGFWFHPAGFILGPTMIGAFWGSFLTAAVIRFTVLKIGGAIMVREKLLPAGLGIFLGAAAAHLFYFSVDFIIYQQNPSSFFPRDPLSAISRLF